MEDSLEDGKPALWETISLRFSTLAYTLEATGDLLKKLMTGPYLTPFLSQSSGWGLDISFNILKSQSIGQGRESVS